ncbi:hypothetical protein GPECTOR_9g687 [Gonium pectorale]|uniref:Uncharacterized protein n=1 Tax=Gonium pectorale TaxID=33097 RepID=A0A150GSF3_GONPE|nr:hypothetical protein GPECTOR_9g687 [Gonium pectorale]|eukprot:KXZ52642.1 hypothetical protein GPECTOR_9g687 [Gonium pectorale]
MATATGSLRLPDRAVHIFFLQQLAKQKLPGKATGCLGDLKTAQVVKEYVQPATAQSKSSFIECLVGGRLDAKHTPDWCPGGKLRLASLPDSPAAVGPTSYFVSHAWSYVFSGLVALVERHYAGLPETDGGKAYVPIFYWVDILAVTQHFTGKFTDHPDSDFPGGQGRGVIRASKAVLFTMYPWRAPIAPTRVWCLFEALTAVQTKGVDLDVLLDTGDSKDTGAQTMLTVAGSLDVRAAQATVTADRTYIMGCIRDGVGIEAFNAILRKRLREVLLVASLRTATQYNDSDALAALLKAGAGRGPDNSLDVPRWLPWGSSDLVVAVLNSLTPANMPGKLVLAGREAGQDSKARRPAGGDPFHHAGLPAYPYMPLHGPIMAAVARLLRRQDGAAPTGDAAPRVSASTSRRRSFAISGSGAGGGSTAPSRAASKSSAGDGDLALSTVSSAAAAAGGGTAGGGLRELWLRPGMVHPTVSFRGWWATPGHMTPTELHLAGAVDPNWKRKEKELEKDPAFKSNYSAWSKAFNEHNNAWKAAEIAKMQASHESRAAVEEKDRRARPARELAERRDRGELWAAVGGVSCLAVLGLYNGWMSGPDVAALGRALQQSRTLKELHLVAMRADADHPGGTPALTRELLAAALRSRSLETLVLVPPELSLMEGLEVPAAAAWDLGGGSALREVTFAPVALGPRAAKQLSELLAPLPSLAGGAIDWRRPRLRCTLPGSDYAPSSGYVRAAMEVQPPPQPAEDESAAADLAPLLKALSAVRDFTAAGPRSAALGHYLAAITGPGAIAALLLRPLEARLEVLAARPAYEWRSANEAKALSEGPVPAARELLAAARRHESAHDEMLRLCLKAAPREYLRQYRSLLPPELLEGAGAGGGVGAHASDSHLAGDDDDFPVDGLAALRLPVAASAGGASGAGRSNSTLARREGGGRDSDSDSDDGDPDGSGGGAGAGHRPSSRGGDLRTVSSSDRDGGGAGGGGYTPSFGGAGGVGVIGNGGSSGAAGGYRPSSGARASPIGGGGGAGSRRGGGGRALGGFRGGAGRPAVVSKRRGYGASCDSDEDGF